MSVPGEAYEAAPFLRRVPTEGVMVKQERAAQTRQALIRAAAEAFADDGYALASLPAISRRAGVSAGALHFHFASKDTLAGEVERAAVAHAEELARHCRSTARNSLHLLTTVMCRLLLATASDPVVRAGFRLSGDPSRKKDAQLRGWWHSWVREQIAQAHRDGELAQDVSPRAATVAVVAATVGLEELADCEGDWLTPERLEEFWSFLLLRLAASPPSASPHTTGAGPG